MKNLAIKGHKERGREVISILETLGGKNDYFKLSGNIEDFYYYIWDDKNIYQASLPSNVRIFSLEEFEKEFPYKVGDLVQIKNSENAYTKHVITGMSWKGLSVAYFIDNVSLIFYFAWELEPYAKVNKETTTLSDVINAINAGCKFLMEETIKVDIPAGYEFVGVDDTLRQVIFEKIKV